MAMTKHGLVTLQFDGRTLPLYGPASFSEAGSTINAEANEDGSGRLTEEPQPYKAEFPLFEGSGITVGGLHGKTGDAVFYSPTTGKVRVYREAQFIVNGATGSRTGEIGTCMVVSDDYYTRTLSVTA